MMMTSLASRCVAGLALALAVVAPASAARVLRPAAPGGAVRALVMGINHYPNLRPEQQLKGARPDADAIAASLRTAGVPEGNIVELVDEAVTRARVIKEMDDLVAKSKKGDLVIVSFSGHGQKVRSYQRWQNRDLFVQSEIVLSGFSASDENKRHEVVVDAEMRAWYFRLDAKGVDIMAVMDSCFGGGMRDVVLGAPGVTTRELRLSVDDTRSADRFHDSFKPIAMTTEEAGADPNRIAHLTFFSGADAKTPVPELAGLDPNDPRQVHGALSYFLSRFIAGELSPDAAAGGKTGAVTRAELFKWLSPEVHQASKQVQVIDYGPRPTDDQTPEQMAAAERQSVFIIGDAGQPHEEPVPVPTADAGDAVRVAIINGPREAFDSIKKGKAALLRSDPGDAEVIWDVAGRRALDQIDSIMDENVDAAVVGRIVDRTYAVREIRKLSVTRILEVRIGDDGRRYSPGDTPRLIANGVGGRWLTVFNIAADGTVQCVVSSSCDNPKMSQNQWTRRPEVEKPFGTDYAVVIATSGPAQDLYQWLRAHNQKPDAFEAVAVLRTALMADQQSRIGTAGLFTVSKPQ